MRIAILVLALLALGVTSCASVTSKRIQQAKPVESLKPGEVNQAGPAASEGLIYFLPRRDVLLTLTVVNKIDGVPVDENHVSQVEIGTTQSYPDLARAYVLLYHKNAIGKNTLDVTVGENGLLTSAASTTKITLVEVLEKLAGVASVSSRAEKINVRQPSRITCDPGTHTFILPIPYFGRPEDTCGITVAVGPPAVTTGTDKSSDSQSSASREFPSAPSGIYYRENLPYTVTVTGGTNGVSKAAIVFSPNQSATHFLPISRTVFSDNNATLAFNNGVPVNYKEEVDGEAVALIKLPANIIGAYFGAMGRVFDAFKGRDEKEATALAQSLKLELAKQKFDACMAALRADARNKTNQADQLGCGSL